MALYRVVKVRQYTEVVEVEADDEEQALSLVYEIDGEIQDDNTICLVGPFLLVGEDK